MADATSAAHDDVTLSRVECRSCGYTLGSVPRCPECSHGELVYLLPDAIPKAWLFAVVLAVVYGIRPVLNAPIMIIMEGSIRAWLNRMVASPEQFTRSVISVASLFFALWLLLGRRSFMRMTPRTQWMVALIPAGLMLVDYIRALLFVL